MGKNFTHGFNGNFARAFHNLGHSDNNFVAMTSPCPYYNWQWTTTEITYSVPGSFVVDAGEGWMRMLSQQADGAATVRGYFQMIAASQRTVNVAISRRDGMSWHATGQVITTAGGHRNEELDLFTDPVYQSASGSLAVPYYRYRLNCRLSVRAGAVSDWARLDFTLS